MNLTVDILSGVGATAFATAAFLLIGGLAWKLRLSRAGAIS
jgi:hypothetical protein